MTAQFYKFTGDPRVIEKSFDATSAEVSISPYREINDLRGYIIVSKDFEQYNFVKLSIAGKTKYYFVTAKTVDTGGRLIMSLEEDVLMTHATLILNTDCMVAQANNGANPYFQNDLPCLVYSRNSEYCGDPLEYDHNNKLFFVLVTAGGSAKSRGGLVTEQPNWSGW